eukprot:209538-Rhodomonas_salina.2
MSGSDAGFGGIGNVRCPVLNEGLATCYAMCGTEIGYGGVYYAVSGTEVGFEGPGRQTVL